MEWKPVLVLPSEEMEADFTRASLRTRLRKLDIVFEALQVDLGLIGVGTSDLLAGKSHTLMWPILQQISLGSFVIVNRDNTVWPLHVGKALAAIDVISG